MSTTKQVKPTDVKSIHFMYRDAHNYKSFFTVTAERIGPERLEALAKAEKLHAGAEEIHIEDDLNMEMRDIPMIEEDGYDDEKDHPFLEIYRIYATTREVFRGEMEDMFGHFDEAWVCDSMLSGDPPEICIEIDKFMGWVESVHGTIGCNDSLQGVLIDKWGEEADQLIDRWIEGMAV